MPHLQLLVKPVSADCNMGCSYCFYRRVSAIYPGPATHRMSAQALEQMISWALRAAGRDATTFCWQGGEPTLAGPHFYREAFQLMRLHGRAGQPVSNLLQTNGLLLDREWAELCRQYRVLVGVSLDGPPDLHDHFRHYQGGGSHARVLEGLHHLAERGVEYNILTLVTSESVGRAGEIYRYLREQGFHFLQFIPCVEVDAEGRPAPWTVPAEAYGDFLCEVFDAWRPEGPAACSVRLFDSLLQWHLTGSTGLCTLDAGCGGYTVVEHTGDLYPCDFFVDRQWRLGHVAQPERDKTVAARFAGLRAANLAACGDCEWLALCRGGCPKDRVTAGGFDRRDYLCEGHRRFFAHAMPALAEMAAEIRRECP